MLKHFFGYNILKSYQKRKKLVRCNAVLVIIQHKRQSFLAFYAANVSIISSKI